MLLTSSWTSVLIHLKEIPVSRKAERKVRGRESGETDFQANRTFIISSPDCVFRPSLFLYCYHERYILFSSLLSIPRSKKETMMERRESIKTTSRVDESRILSPLPEGPELSKVFSPISKCFLAFLFLFRGLKSAIDPIHSEHVLSDDKTHDRDSLISLSVKFPS